MPELLRRRLIILASLLSIIAIAGWSDHLARTGLSLRMFGADGTLVASHSHANLGPSRFNAFVALHPQAIRARWEGYWNVPAPGLSELVLTANGVATVRLDDRETLRVGGDDAARTRASRRIDPGLHRLNVTYQSSSDSEARHSIFLKGLTSSGASIPVARADLSPERPTTRDTMTGWLWPVCAIDAVVVWAALLALSVMRAGIKPWFVRAPFGLLVVALILAVSLRFEALVTVYWGSRAPDFADALAAQIRTLRPGAFEHVPTAHPYDGDPFSYLGIARTMGGFYEPSSREPLFPALIRVALRLAGDQDIGISFLSGLCSSLTCLAIFLLGRRLQSAWAGAFAAFLWAIEWQVISFSVEGWRDGLFALEVAACATALISLHRSPDRKTSALLGLAGGLALLTRLTAFSFLIPGTVAAILLPAVSSRRDRLRAACFAWFWMLLLVGPFMIACALGYGDPFYSVNVHAAFYRGRAGLPGSGGSNVMQLFSQLLSPWEFIETGFIGLTTYPFENKWFGLGAFIPGLGQLVSGLALVGLPILVWRARGVIALAVLFTSIAPYAWTWNIAGGGEWRFTLPAYPFYLVSATVAAESIVRGLSALRDTELRFKALRAAVRVMGTAVFLGASGLWLSRGLDWLRVKGLLDRGLPALIETGSRARYFFPSGWAPVGSSNTSTALALTGPEARIRLPISRGRGASVVLRLGANEESASSVNVFAGDQWVATLSGSRGSGELEAFEIAPDSVNGADPLELRFVIGEGSSIAPALTLLWVRVEPLSGGPAESS